MIHFHGTPITPIAALEKMRGRHLFVSFVHSGQLQQVMDICSTFAIDCGAFSAWKSGTEIDWQEYLKWVESFENHPRFDWAIIPDAIDGDENQNDALVDRFRGSVLSVPVWHLHESIERIQRLCQEFSRVAIGSSGEFATLKTRSWWERMFQVFDAICDDDGFPVAKIHGLRMLDPEVFQAFPFASCDSCNVAMNIGLDSAWRGSYQPASKESRAAILAERIERFTSPAKYVQRSQMEFQLS